MGAIRSSLAFTKIENAHECYRSSRIVIRKLDEPKILYFECNPFSLYFWTYTVIAGLLIFDLIGNVDTLLNESSYIEILIAAVLLFLIFSAKRILVAIVLEKELIYIRELGILSAQEEFSEKVYRFSEISHIELKRYLQKLLGYDYQINFVLNTNQTVPITGMKINNADSKACSKELQSLFEIVDNTKSVSYKIGL